MTGKFGVITTASLLSLALVASALRKNGERQEKGSAGEACYFELTSSSGEIKSPGYPYFYPNDLDCVWIIQSNDSAQFLLQVHEIDLEPSKECEFDTLHVYDGDPVTSTLLRYYCDKGNPDYIRSTANKVSIVFRSDGSVSGNGIRISYSKEPACYQILKTPSGTISSPGYPHGYGSNSTCTYSIVNQKSQSIRLTFKDFDLEPTHACHEFLAVFKETSVGLELVSKHCGSKKLQSVCISGHDVVLKFSAKHSPKRRGFLLDYEASDDPC